MYKNNRTINRKMLTTFTISVLSTFSSMFSTHYRITQHLPLNIKHWTSTRVGSLWPTFLLSMSFSMCSFCTSIHLALLSFVRLHLTWSMHFVHHPLTSHLLATFIFGAIKRILELSMCPPISNLCGQIISCHSFSLSVFPFPTYNFRLSQW